MKSTILKQKTVVDYPATLVGTAFVNRRHLSACLLGLLACFPLCSQAKPNIDIGLTVEESYSDDVFRTEVPPGGGDADKDSFITTLSPSLAISDRGSQTEYRLFYRYRYHHYSNSGFDDRDQNELNAILNRYELDNTLRWYLNGNISNSRTDLAELDNDGQTGTELTETRSLLTGLDYRSGIRKWHNTTTDLSYKRVSTDSTSEDEDLYKAKFSLANGHGMKNLSWNGGGDASKDSNDNETQAYNAKIALNFLSHWGIFTQGNYEKDVPEGKNSNNYEFSSVGLGAQFSSAKSHLAVAYNRELSEAENEFFSVDFDWNPTRHTSASGAYTRRFFGESYSLQISHRNRILTNRITYKDSVTSFSREDQSVGFGFLVCPTGSEVDFSQCYIPNPSSGALEEGEQLVGFQTPVLGITEDLNLVRSLSHHTTYSKGKSTITLNTFWTRTKSLSQGIVNDLSYDKHTGTGISWNLALSSRTTFTLNGGWSRKTNDASSTDESQFDDTYGRLSLSRNLTKKLLGTISYTYDDRDATEPEDSYQENRIGISLKASL